MDNTFLKNRTLPYTVVGLTALIGLVLFATSKGCGGQSGRLVACYAQFKYRWEPDNRLFYTSKLDKTADDLVPSSPPVYLQVAGKEVVFLPDLTSDRAREVFITLGWKERKLRGQNQVEFTDRFSSIEFVDGSFSGAHLTSASNFESTILRFSLSSDGPFVEFPKTKEELVLLFGEPVAWERYLPPRGP